MLVGLLLIFIPLSSIILLMSPNLSKNIVLGFSGVLCLYYSLLLGLRGKLSTVDTQLYLELYSNIDYYLIEIGFVYYVKFLNMLAFTSKEYLLVTSMLSITFLFLAVKRITKNAPVITVATLILIFSSFSTFDLYTNTIRQGLALSIFFYASTFVLRDEHSNNWFCFFIFSLIAISLHNSVIVTTLFFLLSFLLRNNEKIKNVLFFAVVVLSVLAMVGFNLSSQVSHVLSVIGNFSDISFLRKVSNTLKFFSEGSEGALSSLNFFGKLITVAPPLLFLFFIQIEKCKGFMNVVHVYVLLTFIIFLVFANNAYSFRYLYLMNFFVQTSFVLSIFTMLNNFSLRLKCFIFSLMTLFYSVYFVWFTSQASDFILRY